MKPSSARLREALRSFDFETLFIDELGWDRAAGTRAIEVDDETYTLDPIAQKRGMVAFVCGPDEEGKLPPHALRRKIERRIEKESHEHLIVFFDGDRTTQVWQWIRREPGRPIACREHTHAVAQPGDALVQKLQAIAFSLEEEENLTIVDVTGRVRASFDVERVTKRFYDRFQKEHKAFLAFIEGIDQDADRQLYASVMLNRLMFCYFIQKKGFLDGDMDYLRTRLSMVQAERGEDQFHTFYRHFLLRLFHEGLGGSDHSEELEKLLGRIPYLNGGLFDIHELERRERYGDAIQIPDVAFERIFDYFDQYQWHLDDRPLREQNEINPDVLGYIFEKYINQKQMGAYYTKEDITEYISKNTVLPYLFDAARSRCKIAFENPGNRTIWDLLRDDPDRYIYEAVRHGADQPLPEEIAVGVNPPTLHDPVGKGPVATLEARKEWNKPAPPEYAVPTEIWREVVARRQRYEDIHGKLAAGEIRDINDLITLNLDIRQFAQDVVETCEGPDLLRAFWKAIESVTILDPTAGSGAFLFAALNILEPLYEACLDRMEAFVEDLERSGQKHRPEKYSDFRAVLDRVASHPNRKYFVYKSIILNNLFGVDIMDEAVEICKLRLFLKLAAQVEPDISDENLGIEPLPDIDFNIRAGNTLVGYATPEELEASLSSKLDLENTVDKVKTAAADLRQAFDAFRVRQIEGDGSVPAEDKRELRGRLQVLRDTLDEHIATDYEVDLSGGSHNASWLSSHRPFHWFVEFHRIMAGGGFDIIIGNPPYLERRQIDYDVRNYACLGGGAIHAMCIERSAQLLGRSGCMSMIVPLALTSTQRMEVVQGILEDGRSAWYSNFAWRPAKLFDTVNRALTIFVVRASGCLCTFSTSYQKWTSGNREGLFERLSYVEVRRYRSAFWVPKLGSNLERGILGKCAAAGGAVGQLRGRTNSRIYYRTTGGLYWKVFTDFAPRFLVNGKPGHSSRETWFAVSQADQVNAIVAALSSDVFWWWYTITSNLRDLNPSDIQNFPLPGAAVTDAGIRELGQEYIHDIVRNSAMLVRKQRQTGRTETQSFKIQKSKPFIDAIDKVLARYYDFTEEELDFIINYDIKYRMSSDLEAGD